MMFQSRNPFSTALATKPQPDCCHCHLKPLPGTCIYAAPVKKTGSLRHSTQMRGNKLCCVSDEEIPASISPFSQGVCG
jgi:hypothetical protein